MGCCLLRVDPVGAWLPAKKGFETPVMLKCRRRLNELKDDVKLMVVVVINGWDGYVQVVVQLARVASKPTVGLELCS